MNILRIGFDVPRVVLEGLLGIAERFAPSERVQEIQAVREAVLHAQREAVVVIVADGIDPGDRAKSWNRYAGRD